MISGTLAKQVLCKSDLEVVFHSSFSFVINKEQQCRNTETEAYYFVVWVAFTSHEPIKVADSTHISDQG